MQIELTEEEREIISHALRCYLSDLREEIVKTEKRDWRQKLHQEEDVLKQVLARLG